MPYNRPDKSKRLYLDLKNDIYELDDLLNEPLTNFKKYRSLLKDVQSTILLSRSKERKHSALVFLKFKDGNKVELAKKIKSIKLTSALDQFKELKNSKSKESLTSIFLSHSGYEYLGIKENIRPYTNNEKSCFVNGVSDLKPINENVKDLGKKYHLAIRFIWSEKPIVVFGDEKKEITGNEKKDQTWIKKYFNDFCEDIVIRYGNDNFNSDGFITDPLDFRDGISNPRFFNKDHEDNSPLNLVLVPDKSGQYWNSCGSFMAYLKIKINKEAINDKSDLEQAYMMGRFKDGTPVVLQNEDGNTEKVNAKNNKQKVTKLIDKLTSSTELNDIEKEHLINSLVNPSILHTPFDKDIAKNNFDYSDDPKGNKCPFHAHIRKANPRKEETEKRRIVRRGTSYASEENKGIHFISFQGNIKEQFEHIFYWLQSNEGGKEPITNTKTTTINIPKTWGEDDTRELDVEPISSYIEGGYFFAPSISFFECLNKHVEQPPKKNILANLNPNQNIIP